MNENRTHLIACRIVHMPRDFKSRHDVSPASLLREYDFIEVGGQISEDEIVAALRQCPDIINDWLEFSDSKRCQDGWFFRKISDGDFFVSYFPQGPSFSFADGARACAAFIKRELEMISREDRGLDIG